MYDSSHISRILLPVAVLLLAAASGLVAQSDDDLKRSYGISLAAHRGTYERNYLEAGIGIGKMVGMHGLSEPIGSMGMVMIVRADPKRSGRWGPGFTLWCTGLLSYGISGGYFFKPEGNYLWLRPEIGVGYLTARIYYGADFHSATRDFIGGVVHELGVQLYLPVIERKTGDDR